MRMIFWLALGLVSYTYVGYAAIVGLLARLRPPDPAIMPMREETPAVTLVIPAYNERAIIDRKVANCRALEYPAQQLQILFVTDGSDDGTPEALAAYPEVTVLHTPTRMGKAAAMNHAMRHLRENAPTPITIFSDANTEVNKAAIRRLVRHFADPTVGCVAGEKRVRAAPVDQASSSGESLYWRYESTVKRWESTLGNVMGAAGELVAIRSDCYLPIPPETLIDDFVLSFRIAMQGKRLVYEPDAYALEHGSASIADEWKRKRRIAAGGIQAVLWLTPLLNPLRYGLLSWQYISHRVLRWTVTPLALALLLPLNGWLAWKRGGLYSLFMAAQTLFYGAAWLGWRLETRRIRWKPLFVPFYFTLMNLAVFAGLVRLVRGREDVRWERAPLRMKHAKVSQQGLPARQTKTTAPQGLLTLGEQLDTIGEEVTTMEKEAIQLYADPELKRRVEEAAAKHNIPVADYLLEAIEQKLADDAKLDEVNTESPVKPKGLDDQLLEDMRELRERILARRGGKPIEIDALELVRSEREDELTNMR